MFLSLIVHSPYFYPIFLPNFLSFLPFVIFSWLMTFRYTHTHTQRFKFWCVVVLGEKRYYAGKKKNVLHKFTPCWCNLEHSGEWWENSLRGKIEKRQENLFLGFSWVHFAVMQINQEHLHTYTHICRASFLTRKSFLFHLNCQLVTKCYKIGEFIAPEM